MDKTGLEEKIQRKLRLPTGTEAKLILQIQEYFKRSGKQTAIIGLSGGVDSSLVCHLAAKAIGAGNVYAFHMPYSQNPQDERDAQGYAKKLGVNYRKIEMRRVVDALSETFRPTNRIASGNLRVRARMVALYTYANEFGGLVLGTGNRSELLLGYFTKFGDGGCDLLPIGSLYKSQVWRLAESAGVPEMIINKAPSAGMWENQTDEKELGVEYELIDKILVSHFDLKMKWEALEPYFDKAKVSRVRHLHESTQHKRILPPIL